MSNKEVEINLNVKKDDGSANVEQSAEAQAVAADTVKADAEMAKLMQEVSADREQQSANGHADEVTNAAHA